MVAVYMIALIDDLRDVFGMSDDSDVFASASRNSGR